MSSSCLTVVALLVASSAAEAQYVISTYAGGAPPPTPAAGVGASIGQPGGVAVDSAGNLYFSSDNCVFKLGPNGVLTRVAGNARPGYSGDGGPATNAALDGPLSVASDGTGNLYVADAGNNRVRRVSTAGIITTVAGNGSGGYSGDGGPATSASVYFPHGVTVDSAGNIYIADTSNYRIRRVSANGIITTVAGNGTCCSSGDGGPAISASLNWPNGIAVDSVGNVYIADTDNNRIRRVSTAGIITTVAGNGVQGSSGDSGPATGAQLNFPSGVAVDSAGNLYIADTENSRIRRVSTEGIITTVAGGGTAYPGDGGPAISAYVYQPSGVTVDSAGNLYIADNNRVGRVSQVGIITTIAGNGTPGYSGDGGSATSAQLAFNSILAAGVAVDGAGSLYFPDASNNRVRRVSPAGIITTVAGNGAPGYSGDGGLAISAQLNDPSAVAVDSAGNIYIADARNYRVRRVSPNGTISTIAGTGTPGESGDGGPASAAQFYFLNGVAVDSADNLYIAEGGNRIRRVPPDGIITTVAGGDNNASLGDGGPATSAQLSNPYGVTVDSAGNLYIADTFNDRVRRVSTAGVITTVAGSGPLPGQAGAYSGDGGPATSAQLFFPSGVALDSTGNLYIADQFNHRIRRVSTAGIITTVSGNGIYGYSGDGGPATSAQLGSPESVAVDSAGNLYIADLYVGAIRLLKPTNAPVLISAIVDAASEAVAPISPGKIVTIYGGGMGPSTLAQFQVNNSSIGTQLAGTTVSFNGIAAPIVYTSATQVAAIVPYEITGTSAQVVVSYQGQTSAAFTVLIAASAPGLFSLNGTGAGQAAAINAIDGSVNDAAHPVKIGGYISLFATGEGQTTPSGIDGKLASGFPLPAPSLRVSAMVGGIPAAVQYAGAALGEVAGVMQVNVQIPAGVQPGGYVSVVLQVGNASTTAGAIWIAVAGN